jgi:flagellar hook-basal body complex protein FliE
MSDASINAILSQIRSLQGQLQTSRPAPVETPAPAAAEGGFGNTLKRAVGQVNEEQNQSAALAKAFELGDPNVDLVRVMLASQQASVSFRATVEVRNRLVQAYQDVMNMPL